VLAAVIVAEHPLDDNFRRSSATFYSLPSEITSHFDSVELKSSLHQMATSVASSVCDLRGSTFVRHTPLV